MTRITVDVDDALLDEAKQVLGTGSKVATINEALRAIVRRRQAAEIVSALSSVSMDFSGSAQSWRYGGGRDLSRLVEDARDVDAA